MNPTCLIFGQGHFFHKARIEALRTGEIACGLEPFLLLSQQSDFAKVVDERKPRFAATSGMQKEEAKARALLADRGIPILVLDLGYIRRPQGDRDTQGFNQVGLGKLGWMPTTPCPSDRLDRLQITVAPLVVEEPKRCLVLGQMPGDSSHGMDQPTLALWYEQRCQNLRASGYELHWRPHPHTATMPAPIEGCILHNPHAESLADNLRGMSLALAFNSTAGIEALLAGVRVICDQSCYYAGQREPGQKPGSFPQFLANLAYAQWTCTEIASGEPLRFLNQFAPLLP